MPKAKTRMTQGFSDTFYRVHLYSVAMIKKRKCNIHKSPPQKTIFKRKKEINIMKKFMNSIKKKVENMGVCAICKVSEAKTILANCSGEAYLDLVIFS